MKVAREADVEGGDFADIVRRVTDTLRRRWLTFALVAGMLFAVAIALVLLMTPQYTAVTHLRIDPSRSPVAADADKSQLSPEAIETEISMLRSDDIARAVVRKLNMSNDPEFAKGLDGSPMTQSDRETAVANRMLDKLSVSRNKLSYILGIEFTSVDRVKAAKVANAFAAAYLYSKVGSKNDVASQKAVFLSGQITKLGDEIRQTEAQVANYRAAAGITGSVGDAGMATANIVDQQIGPISTQLAEARSQAAEAQAALAAAQAQARAGNADAIGEVLASPVVVQARAQRGQLLQNMGEVLARYGERHPETIRVREQLRDLDAQIAAETTRVLAALQSRAATANARADSLQASIDMLASKQSSNARAAVLANSLESEIASKRTQYDKISQELIETTQASKNQIAQAEIIDTAKPPIHPSRPNKPMLLALGLMVAFAAAAGTITVQELMVTGLRTSEEIEDVLGVPMLAAIPQEKVENAADLVLDKPTSLFSEAFRIARASLLGVRGDSMPQIIAITSALPAEGKTTTALALARTLAINGQKTLLIDCDVRRAVMRGLVRNPVDAPGIVEVLHGKMPLDAAITPGDVEKLDHLLVSQPYFSSENLFGDGRMQDVLSKLRSRYDLIVLDLPPLMGLADGRFLAAMADTVAMVLRWDETPASAATTAMNAMISDQSKVAGVIMTMVHAGSEAMGGLYYSKKYTGYYQQQ
jgi:succinoglycan biosynthesis transport protein ExoP